MVPAKRASRRGARTKSEESHRKALPASSATALCRSAGPQYQWWPWRMHVRTLRHYQKNRKHEWVVQSRNVSLNSDAGKASEEEDGRRDSRHRIKDQRESRIPLARFLVPLVRWLRRALLLPPGPRRPWRRALLLSLYSQRRALKRIPILSQPDRGHPSKDSSMRPKGARRRTKGGGLCRE